MSNKVNAPASGTQSIERAVRILKELATFGPAGTSVPRLVPQTKLEYPTVYRILQCLVKEGLVYRDQRTRRYSLGSLICELGLSAPPQMNLRDLCAPISLRIAEKTGDTVFLNVRSGLDALCIDRREGSFPIKTLIFEIGHRRPLGIGAGGLALLMSLPPHEVEEIIHANAPRLYQTGNITARKILDKVNRARETGYAVVEDAVVKGVTVISLPFGAPNAIPSAAISVATVVSRMPPSRQKDVISLLRYEVGELAGLLGSAT